GGGFRGAMRARSSEESLPVGEQEGEAKGYELPAFPHDGPLSELWNSGRPPAQPALSQNDCVTVLPVMERELRAEARHAFTYWLRALGTSVSLIIFAVMMIDARDNAPGLGAKLFGNLNTALFITIWLLAPLLTADCLSRER